MTRFLSFLTVSAAACLLQGGVSVALAQIEMNAAPVATPVPSLPPSGVTPQIQAEVNRTRHLVREVRENTDNIQNKGDFGAQLWLVQGTSFFEDWRKPVEPSIDPVTIVQRNSTISTVIIFYGPARSDTGACNVDYDITVKRPNGSIYNRRDNIIGWQDLAPTNGRLMLGRNYVSLNFGIDDPAGVYTVEAIVHDNVSRAELPLKQTFVLQ